MIYLSICSGSVLNVNSSLKKTFSFKAEDWLQFNALIIKFVLLKS